MKLTRHTDYALRLLMTLALQPEAPRTIDDVARSFRISADHLRKVAQTLARAGFIRTARGRGGGVKLARAPAAIVLGAVVRATEESFALVECQAPEAAHCAIAAACVLPRPLQLAVQAFLEVLDRYTLADLVTGPHRRGKLRDLLAP